MMISILFYYLLLTSGVKASGLEIYRKKELGHMACGHMIGKYVQPYERFEHQHIDFCDIENQPALGSMILCIIDCFDYSDLFLKDFQQSCSKEHLNFSEIYNSYRNATKYSVNSSYYESQVDTSDPYMRYKFPDFELPFPYPVHLPPQQVQGYYKVLYKDYQTSNWEIYFGVALTSYWFLVMMVAAIFNWLYYLMPNYVKTWYGGPTNWIRRNVTLAPLARKQHIFSNNRFIGFIPTRLESLILCGWICLIIAFCFPQINQPIQASIVAAVGNRLAYLACFTYPLLILFAGRNNFMQTVTGWSFSRFLTFHRWTSRVVFLLILLHAICETTYLKNVNAYTKFGRTDPIIYGYVGMTAMSIIVFQSLYFFRSKRYEIFLLIHITMVAIVLASGWKHTKYVGGVELFYCSVAVWVFDRIVRICRIVSFGIQPATLQLEANETLKVIVKRPTYWKPYPGSHAFIHFLKPTLFWQSHPFTIIDSISGENTISFYIKVKGGMSHGLCQDICKRPDNKLRMNVLVEGPYSQTITIHNYHKAVFLAGGNGIPGMYFEAWNMAKKIHQEQNVPYQRIKFIWVIRHFKSIDWFYEELKNFEQYDFMKVKIYITRSEEDSSYQEDNDSGFFFNSYESEEEPTNTPVANEDEFGEEEECGDVEYGNEEVVAETAATHSGKEEVSEKKMSVSSCYSFLTYLQLKLPHIKFKLGRPDINKIVSREVNSTKHSIAFATCAHPCMVDEVRNSIRHRLSTSQRVELFEQVQSW